MNALKQALYSLSQKADLSFDEMRACMNIIMSGDATQAQIGAFLMGLRTKGETVDEMSAAVCVLREKMLPVQAPENAIDIVGTGGDGAGTYNISTATALCVAACDVTVAKHGNKALSSKSGSSEALEQLGVQLDLSPEQISACIKQTGIGFMFAPDHHAAMRFVGTARAQLGIRTLFNLLGPQCNPASVTHYILGVFDPMWVRPVAESLLQNGATRAMVVHGLDGLDELTITAPTKVAHLQDGTIDEIQINPEDIGIERAPLSYLVGGDPAHNAAAIKRLFANQLDGLEAYHDIVVLNGAAALVVADRAENLAQGAEYIRQAIRSGAALDKLEQLVAVSNKIKA